jgi:hypothetical protein
MLKSITGDNANDLANSVNHYGITREQMIQFVPNKNGSVSLFYEQE